MRGRRIYEIRNVLHRCYTSYICLYNQCLCLVVPYIEEEPPQNREEQTLQTVREDAGLQPATEQTLQAICRNDSARSVHVSYLRLVHLAVGLHHAQRVGDRVGHDGGAEANERAASERL